MPAELLQLRDAQLSIEGGVAEFTHQRPERRNPLSLELRQDYIDMLARVEGDRDIRALIVTGSGAAFCAGGDLKNLNQRLDNSDPQRSLADDLRRRVLDVHTWFDRLRNLEIPVIAAVDGPAVGAGMSIALAADIVLASRHAYFSMSFAKMGLVPDMAAAYILPRIVGMAIAKDLMLTARRVDAEEAKQLGLVHSIYTNDSLLAEARNFARRFAAGPQQALGPIKRLLNRSFETSYATLAELEANAQAVASTTAYHTEALRRFARGEPALYDWDSMAKA